MTLKLKVVATRAAAIALLDVLDMACSFHAICLACPPAQASKKGAPFQSIKTFVSCTAAAFEIGKITRNRGLGVSEKAGHLDLWLSASRDSRQGVPSPGGIARNGLRLEAKMVSWLLRVLLLVAGSITGYFVAKDSPNFGLVQMMVAIIVIVLAVFVLAFWPARWSRTLDRARSGAGGGRP